MELEQPGAVVPTCNSASFKGNRFPLDAGSPELAIPDGVLLDNHPCFAVGVERPLLIDPAWDDPLDHITWRPLDPDHPEGPWRAFHRSPRGRVTIHVLGLDGRNVDRAGDHIRHAVRPWVDRVAASLSSPGHARAIWNEALKHLFAPAQPFHAATHDALDFFLPADVRARAGLVLPRPGAPLAARSVVSPAPASSASHAALPDDVKLQLIAAEQGTPELIALICRTRPSTTDELANLLEVSVATVMRHCRALVGAGTLVTDSSGRYALVGSRPH